MATLYISEFRNIGTIRTEQAQVLAQPAITDQTVAIGATTEPSAAFNAETKLVLLCADAICSIKFGSTEVLSAAAITNMRLPADTPIPFAVSPGHFVSVIANT